MEQSIKKGAGVVIVKDRQVLLVKHGPKAEHLNNTFGIPSGRVNKDESDIDCAIRELKEETNLLALKKDLIQLDKPYIAAIKRKTEGTKTYSMIVFKCNKFSGELKSNDETEPLWINLSDLDKLILLPNIKKIVNDSFDY